MESGSLNIILGKGPSARTIQLELPPFTLIAATTRIALVSAPLRSRFSGGVFRLDFYTPQEIERIVGRSASILGVQAHTDAIAEIARRSRFTPRTANYLLKRCRDYAQIKKKDLTKAMVEEALELLGVDTVGLTESDRKLLSAIIDTFSGGPVGLGTLAAALSEDEATLEEYNEPYLMQVGLIERTPRGRTVTRRAHEHLQTKASGKLL
jgi:Holliday junction DNA helicase RuvB